MMNLIFVIWVYEMAGILVTGLALLSLYVYFYAKYGRKITKRVLDELYGEGDEVTLDSILKAMVIWPYLIPRNTARTFWEMNRYIVYHGYVNRVR